MTAPTASTAMASTSSLDWTMRLGGALVALHALFLLVQDVGFGLSDNIFCMICLGLGLVAFAVSWVPTHEGDSL